MFERWLNEKTSFQSDGSRNKGAMAQNGKSDGSNGKHLKSDGSHNHDIFKVTSDGSNNDDLHTCHIKLAGAS